MGEETEGEEIVAVGIVIVIVIMVVIVIVIVLLSGGRWGLSGYALSGRGKLRVDITQIVFNGYFYSLY